MKMTKLSVMALAAVAGFTTAATAETKVALVPGGPHPFFANWEGGGVDAVSDFGVAASDYRVPQEWKLDMQNKMLESLVSQGYNAFAVFPGDANGTNAMVSELKDFGAPTVSIAGCTQSPSPVEFCLATDVYKSAYMGTMALIEAMGDEGKIVHETSLLIDPNTQLRVAAVEQAIADAQADGKKVELYQHLTDVDDQEKADQKINALLAGKAHEFDGLVSTAWVASVVTSKALRASNNEDLKFIAIDHDKIVLDAIRDGVIQGTMLQNPHGQAYIATYALDKLLNGCSIKADAPFTPTPQHETFIDSGTMLVTKDNIGNWEAEMKAVTDEIMATFDEKFLDCAS
ncbi:sugar ABC transporter substrate-binding protein [Actibacterium mucosum KCTC 23349]|uniref:Sugar ABC transporter substrate-binding protein n=1 Tax=Actibacterium mucosum KCTC 23349 TaxID=1454373 RepID=A0A037ZKX9_9RHOB|nr:sugar ABC transporter substrate-binding protein [Actibacterium mucosum]KAJ55461.1 sugar ABC transporter substrate-binding protein [Actibacterium mucosum KCTC 23349]